MTTHIFVCPVCYRNNIFPPPNSRRWELWELFDLLECADCGARFPNGECMEKTSEEFCYVGRAACGCIQAICMDGDTKRTADYVAEFIREGLTIDRVTVEYGKANFMNECDACRSPVRDDLFDEAA